MMELTPTERHALESGQTVEVVDPSTASVMVGREQQATLESSGVSLTMLKSQEAYWRDLPELLKLRSDDRQWVAYHENARVGFAKTCAELYQECARRGLKRGEFYVDRLEPRALPPWTEEIIEAHYETNPAA